jgi:N-methylhydantoinase A/oxoprolinase/acetone carboxylase beta subunit
VSLSPTLIVTAHKAPTTADVTTGITEAINTVIRTSNVPLSAVDCVIIGTTHFVNAVVQRSSSLRRVGVVRLCGGPKDGFGFEIPPFIDFPADLRQLIHGKNFYCQGGYQISGTEISSLDETELVKIAEELVSERIFNVVVAGIYSPLDSTHEVRAGEIITQRMRELCISSGISARPRITLSHQISSVGFLARENAAILNAALRPLAEKTILGFQKAIENTFAGQPVALYLTQNDGSILSAPDAVDLPIRTFNSGPTNSIRGGEFLWRTAITGADADEQSSERQDALVVIDIGGTTSDSGLLLPNGVPRMSSLMSVVGGVRTNFALPAVESIGLGGGSVVRTSGTELTVGPDSVALELLQKARLFGGDTLTATDIVAAGQLDSPTTNGPLKGLGDPQRLKDIPADVVKSARKAMRRIIETVVDRTKVQKGDVDVLIVGGGAILIDTSEPLAGVRNVRTVKGGEVANAVGAAVSEVAGIVDTVVDTSSQTLKEAQDEVVRLAVEASVTKGAMPDTVRVAEVTVLPIQYVDAKARIVVRAMGTLDAVQSTKDASSAAEVLVPPDQDERGKVSSNIDATNISNSVNIQTYKPEIKNGEWIISFTDIEWISDGCRVLGCGGGGDPYQQYLKVRSILERAPGSVRVVSPHSLSESAMIGLTGMVSLVLHNPYWANRSCYMSLPYPRVSCCSSYLLDRVLT